MQDIIDQVRKILKGFWRNRWAAIAVAWIVAIVGWSAIFFVPNVYSSSAKVYADTDSLLGSLIGDLTVQPNLNVRLEAVTKTLKTWPNLEKVMRMTDMDLDINSNEERERLLASLDEKININIGRGIDLYTISYSDKDPQRAKDVVQALLDIFLDTTLGENREDSSDAQQFIQAEIEEYESKLAKAENKLVDFKKQHQGALPSQEKDYFARLSALRDQLQEARFELNLASQRVATLNRELSSFRRNAGSDTASTTLVTSVDERLEALRNTLDELLLRYTEEYPTVIETRASIQELEAQRKQELKELSQSGADTGALSDNTLFQELRLAISEAQARAAEARVSVAEYERRIEEMRNVVETLPKVEAQLAALNRDYTTYKAQYDALVQRRESAKLSERAGASGDTIKLNIVEPPRVPIAPSGPNRFLLTTLVLFASIATALGLVFLLGELRPVIYDVKDLRRATGLPVLGSITVLDSMRKHYGVGKKSILVFAGAGALFIGFYLVVLLVQVSYFEDVRLLIGAAGAF